MCICVDLWRKLSTKELMLLNCDVGEDSWESLRLQGDLTSPFWRRSALGFLWREWCWSWNSSTLATSCKELTHWKRLWCWVGLGAGGEGDDRGWDGWMASLTRWTWVWVNSGSLWWTRRPGVLRFMGSQTVGHDWATELNWMPLLILLSLYWCCLDCLMYYQLSNPFYFCPGQQATTCSASLTRIYKTTASHWKSHPPLDGHCCKDSEAWEQQEWRPNAPLHPSSAGSSQRHLNAPISKNWSSHFLREEC